MTKIRKSVTVIAAVSAVLFLAGCSASRSEALEVPGSVLELTDDSWGNSTWGYVTESGEVIEMTNCGWPSLFEQHYCEDDEGTYHFQWGTSKHGSITNPNITVDGVKHRLSCRMDADTALSNLSVCVPKD